MTRIETVVGPLYVDDRGAGPAVLLWPSLFCDARTLEPRSAPSRANPSSDRRASAVLHADAWLCPHCGRRMRLRAVVQGSYATRRVLSGLGRGPPAFEVA